MLRPGHRLSDPANGGMRFVETGRLTLEPQTEAHAEAMFVVLSDPAIYEHENEPPASLEWLRTRFAKLESRTSADGGDQWLNWVIRLPTDDLIGYVQATVHPDGRAAIAYELASAYWGRGLAHEAVGAMMNELVERYGVRSFLCGAETHESPLRAPARASGLLARAVRSTPDAVDRSRRNADVPRRPTSMKKARAAANIPSGANARDASHPVSEAPLVRIVAGGAPAKTAVRHPTCAET